MSWIWARPTCLQTVSSHKRKRLSELPPASGIWVEVASRLNSSFFEAGEGGLPPVWCWLCASIDSQSVFSLYSTKRLWSCRYTLCAPTGREHQGMWRGFHYPYWKDNTAASCVWQMCFFQSGVGWREVIWRCWPTVCTVQHLGKAKQSSCLWQGRMKAVQLGSSRRGSSAFCRVVEPRLPYKFFLSLPKCQIRFQDWNNSGYFPPLRRDLRVYFSMYTYPLTKGRYLEESLWWSLDLINMSGQWIKPKERTAREHKSFLPLPFSGRRPLPDSPGQPQPRHPGRRPLAVLGGLAALPAITCPHLQGLEHHRRAGVFQQGHSLVPTDPCQVDSVHIQEDVTCDKKGMVEKTLQMLLRCIPIDNKPNPEPRTCCLMEMLMASPNALPINAVCPCRGTPPSKPGVLLLRPICIPCAGSPSTAEWTCPAVCP